MTGVLHGMFMGSGSEQITLTDRTLSGIGSSPATVGYKLDNVGDEYNQLPGGSYTDVGDWISPKGAAPGSYEVRATLNSGTSPSGSAVGSWLALTSTRMWELTQTGTGSKTCNLTIEIRLGSTTLGSCTVDLSTQVL